MEIYQKTPSGGKISFEQFRKFFTDDDLVKGEKRGELKTVGMWQIPINYKALAVNVKNCEIIGYRTMYNLSQMGYTMGGIVSVNGKKCKCFNSSILFELPDGKLFECAIIYVI